MEGSDESLRVDMGLIVGDGVTRGTGHCSQCLNLESKIKTIEDFWSALKQDVNEKRKEFKLLEVKYEKLRVEKVAVENELEVLKRRNCELEERTREIENNHHGEEKDEEDKVLQLMIENKVLECEKRKAESDAERRKLECKELQLKVLELEKKLVPKEELHESIDLQEVHRMVKVEERVHNNDGLDAIGEEIGFLQHQDSGKSLTKTPYMQAKHVEGDKASVSESGKNHVNQVRKRLTFEEDMGSNKRMAPSTPAGVRPTNVVIDITQSDDERTFVPLCTSRNDVQTSVPICTPPPTGCRTSRTSLNCGSRNILSNNDLHTYNILKRTAVDQGGEDDLICEDGKVLYISTPKRRRVSQIIASDSDSGDDDNVPIQALRTRKFQEKNTNNHPKGHSVQTGRYKNRVGQSFSRRRLVKHSQCEEKGGATKSHVNVRKTGDAKCHSGISTGYIDSDEEAEEEDVSCSEGESLGGFIVSGSEYSDDEDVSNSDGALESNASVAEDSIANSEYISESDPDYDEIISRIQRNKNDKLEWEFEGEMLASFGKDPELCMRAVCALYRQQTPGEKCSKETIVLNHRGFSQCDAFRGSTLAEFLTDGDPQVDMKKSVEELQAYDPKGIELCRTLATRYSRQLFTIYKNKEDPLFSAS